MGEILLVKVKSIYGEIKGLYKGLPKRVSGPYCVPAIIGERFNTALDLLTQASNSDYSRFKISTEELNRGENCNIRVIEPLMLTVVSKLESEYNFDYEKKGASPNIVIINKNANEVSIRIDYTIEDLINKFNGEASIKLNELKTELGKGTKNWEIIKNILIWILNFSKDLFLQVIPLIIEKKL